LIAQPRVLLPTSLDLWGYGVKAAHGAPSSLREPAELEVHAGELL
jgi:hypothetical protein